MTTETKIKTTSKGQSVTFSDGSVWVDGACVWSGSGPLPVPASLKGKVPAGIEYLAGRVCLTASEASILRGAIAEWETTAKAEYLAKAEPEHCERCKVQVDGKIRRTGSFRGAKTSDPYCASCNDLLTVMGGQEPIDDRTPYHKSEDHEANS